MASTTEHLNLVETHAEPRLVNCQQVHGLHVRSGRVLYEPLGISDGDPARALRDAIAAKADGLLITDARTGETWYVPVRQVLAHDMRTQLDLVRHLDSWHRSQGHESCWCGRWVHPDDLYEGTCGAVDCLRTAALDAAGLVP